MSLMGIRYSPQNAGIYALILQEAGGDRCLPIVIGASEAQSIECKLQEIITPRPLTHDLMTNVMRAFGLQLRRVELRRLESGVYAANLYLSDGERELTLDSRSSDAIAIAIRVGAPVYAPSALLDEAGIRKANNATPAPEQPRQSESVQSYEGKSETELLELMNEAAEKEDYEEAARVKQALDALRKKELDDLEDII